MARTKLGNAETVIGKGTLLDGTFELEHGLRVEGVLRGERLLSRKSLIVAPEGEVLSAHIEVGEATIGGRVAGALKAQRKVHLQAGARFCGRLETPHLVLEEGAEMLEDREAGRTEEGETD